MPPACCQSCLLRHPRQSLWMCSRWRHSRLQRCCNSGLLPPPKAQRRRQGSRVSVGCSRAKVGGMVLVMVSLQIYLCLPSWLLWPLPDMSSRLLPVMSPGEACMALLARCAIALCHPNRHVREAAALCVQACAKLLQLTPGSDLTGALLVQPSGPVACIRT